MCMYTFRCRCIYRYMYVYIFTYMCVYIYKCHRKMSEHNTVTPKCAASKMYSFKRHPESGGLLGGFSWAPPNEYAIEVIGQTSPHMKITCGFSIGTWNPAACRVDFHGPLLREMAKEFFCKYIGERFYIFFWNPRLPQKLASI